MRPLLIYLSLKEYKKDAWNFPKMHLIQHLFEDIEAKGVTRNFTSKTFEKMHGPLGETYIRMTNFKEVGGQVSSYRSKHVYWYD